MLVTPRNNYTYVRDKGKKVKQNVMIQNLGYKLNETNTKVTVINVCGYYLWWLLIVANISYDTNCQIELSKARAYN